MPVLLDIYLYVATLPPSKTVCIFPPLSFLLLSHLRFFQYIPVPFLSPINRRKALSEHSIRNDFRMIRPDKSFICSLLSGNDYYEAAMRGEREREREGGIGLREDRFGSTSFPEYAHRCVFCCKIPHGKYQLRKRYLYAYIRFSHLTTTLIISWDKRVYTRISVN